MLTLAKSWGTLLLKIVVWHEILDFLVSVATLEMWKSFKRLCLVLCWAQLLHIANCPR